MDAREVVDAVKDWLQSERLEIREVKDHQNIMHLHVRYPPTKQGHVFNVVIPKNRNLVLVYSITRVDEGQQSKMISHNEEDSGGWETWLHEARLHLTQANLDWVLHVGKKRGDNLGPLQAFNLSRPIWFDGLTQNEFMHTMRHVWLSKLALIHKIKFGYGPGTGKPGPVDDWIAKKAQKSASKGGVSGKPESSVDMDETGGFGRDFDPDEWA
ncbi:MAG: DUF2299 family protein [Euryarchaeota archaeon]|jgi:hypothetical protein|nr:DUF2299 family protein [Euryarchaeota archaeon]MBT3654030.1 DUF2299 family protein [Euryarchaeota archaeon]MBT3757429.1 DUF2299 family protein [Euryarchaeota archaeon]MBT4051276.1 DUF2299 family protein [Euryarchaeota archaeon]MBT4346393.1 DUF2299 family protein [Euryarchaeota archaeon]|tara:strand:- start:21146 stop:21781 length:636 start_codon:yes stop_codon:yes gene_type:complete